MDDPNDTTDLTGLSGLTGSLGDRDPMFHVVAGMVVVVAAWLFLTPWVPALGDVMMRRFHLQSRSFAEFAATFPVPAMYNFSNRYRVSGTPPRSLTSDAPEDFFADDDSGSPARHANHYPARTFTFADARYRHFFDGQTRWVELESRYRGRTARSILRVDPTPPAAGDSPRTLRYVVHRLRWEHTDE